jgi:glycosyltransferase involved in cell wall biosynthesis
MRISVVTPNYNMACYLEDTIKSVIENLRPGDEYFVIDGGSTDGSLDVIRRYEKQLTAWVSESDEGYADAIGKGFDRATGDILCWINSSDLYLAGALETASSLMTGQIDLIFGDNFYIDERNRVLRFSKGWVPDLRAATLYGGWTPLQEACFWRRELYESVGGIDTSLQFAADYDLFLRMSSATRAEYVPFAFSGFRRHQGQKSLSGTPSYQRERWHCRSRELQIHEETWPAQRFKRVLFRLMMSVRARAAPLVWQRPDLSGIPIATLPCARY